MLTVAVPKRNKLPNIIVLTPKDGPWEIASKADIYEGYRGYKAFLEKME